MSTHLLRLFPAHDRMQTLVESEVRVSVEGRQHEFDDVFGNRARRLLLDVPYHELTIEARSRVETSTPIRCRSTFATFRR